MKTAPSLQHGLPPHWLHEAEHKPSFTATGVQPPVLGMLSRDRRMPITTLFLDVGGSANQWMGPPRPQTSRAEFQLDWAEMEERHRLTFEIHEEGKLTFE